VPLLERPCFANFGVLQLIIFANEQFFPTCSIDLNVCGDLFLQDHEKVQSLQN